MSLAFSPVCSFTQVQLGQVEIKCPITECFEFLEETTVIYHLTHEDSIKYKYFLELGRIDSSTKPCPQCKHFTTFKKKGHIPTPSRSESKYKVSMFTRIVGYMSHDGTAKLGQLVVGIKWASFLCRTLRWVDIGSDSENICLGRLMIRENSWGFN